MFKHRGVGYRFAFHENKNIVYLRPTLGSTLAGLLPILVVNGALIVALRSLSKKADAELQELVKEFDENED